MVTIIKLSSTELSKLNMAVGFNRWIPTEDARGKAELKQKLKKFLSIKKDVWCAVDSNLIVGFGVVGNLTGLPGGKTIETLEVAQPYRRRGIGSLILGQILNEYGEAIMALNPSPELGYERELEEFYKRHGFRSFSEDLMVHFPSDIEKLRRWMIRLDELLDTYKLLRRKMAEELPLKTGFNQGVT